MSDVGAAGLPLGQSSIISFCLGGLVGAAALYYINSKVNFISEHEHEDLNGFGTLNAACNGEQQDVAPSTASLRSKVTVQHDFQEDPILQEHLTRNVQFFGLENQKKIANAFVVVVGLGGVGSHAAHLLLRSGVGHLRLVDFDQVTLSSLNRHCLATRNDVGIPKATCLASHFNDIMPEAQVEAMVSMYDDSTENVVLAGQPDFVLDAIDNIDTKVALLAACKKRGIKVLSVAGAGAKADPTRLKFVDVAESSIDPLARSVRQRLRKEHNIENGVPILLSTEKPRCGLIFVPEDDENLTSTNPLDYQVVPNFRIRTIPVLGTVPALFGMAAASYILCELAQAPFSPEPMHRIQAKAITTQYDRLESRERDTYGSIDGVQVDAQEVEILVRELWRGTSARATTPPTTDRGITRVLGDLCLTRWDPAITATVDNLVMLSREEAAAHDEMVGKAGGLEKLKKEEPEFCKRVERVLERARYEFKYGYY